MAHLDEIRIQTIQSCLMFRAELGAKTVRITTHACFVLARLATALVRVDKFNFQNEMADFHNVFSK